MNWAMNKRMVICVFTGFSSGLPLYVLIQLVPAWLRDQGVSLTEIGLFALVGIPFTWKFLWAPFMDRYVPPFLGRRRGWMLLSQLALIVSIGFLGILGQSCITHGFTLGEATVTVPFDYMRIVYSAIFGILLFAEIPSWWSVAGAVLIVGSNLYLVKRG